MGTSRQSSRDVEEVIMSHKSLAILVVAALYFGLLRGNEVGSGGITDVAVIIVIIYIVVKNLQDKNS